MQIVSYLLLRNSQKSLKSPIKSFIFALFDNSPHCALAVNVRACKREIKSDIPANALYDV